MKISAVGLAVLASLALSACTYTAMTPTRTIGDGDPKGPPPARVTRLSEVVQGQSLSNYRVSIYPGLDQFFNPNPTLTVAEYSQIRQLDYYCANEADKLFGAGKQIGKQALSYALPIAVMTALGAQLAFGHLITPEDYLITGAAAGIGSGIAGGDVTYANAKRLVQGYCMTGMATKAQQLEGKLARIFIIPVYAGESNMPEVSDKPAPNYRAAPRRSTTTAPTVPLTP